MVDNTYKMKLIETGLFQKTFSGRNEYRGLCPFCGNPKKKFYLHIDLDSDDPVMYNCFHCPAQGYLNYKLLEQLGLDGSIELPSDVKRMKKLSVDTVVDSVQLDTVNENDNIGDVCQYISKRIGVTPTFDDLLKFQYIGNPSMYCSEYIGMDDINSLRNKRMWFKTTNGNIIGTNGNDWLTYKSNRVREGRMHQMKTPIDMYNDINVMITTDIMDEIGLYYNFKELDNCMYIAVFNKQYYRGIKHVLNKGIFGKGVHINIFKDPTVKDIFIDNDMRKLFGKVSIYENTCNLGYGDTKDKLMIHRIERR